MRYTIFYSWQSDLPNATNWGFIEKALEKAARSIRSDDSISVEPVIDRDTSGVPGSPDIAGTIFEKIDRCDVFVCDVSIINDGLGTRPTPNPNVLVELGYALKTLGPGRVILVANTAFGKLELLPFDLRMRRVISYQMPEGATDRATERDLLAKALERALRSIIEKLEAERAEPAPITLPTPPEMLLTAIENGDPRQGVLAARYMEWLVEALDKLAPIYDGSDQPDELFVRSIENTIDVVTEFAGLAQAIAVENASDAALSLYKGFEKIIDRYNQKSRGPGVHSYNRTDFDFYKFLGHELFVTLFSLLIREKRWELIADLLEERLYIEESLPHEGKLVTFEYISKFVYILRDRNDRLRLGRVSLHADILKERHSPGSLAEIMPFRLFVDTDYFLYLRSAFSVPATQRDDDWAPWSNVYLYDITPRFLIEAYHAKYAQRLLRPLGIRSIEEFRQLLAERGDKVKGMFGYGPIIEPLRRFEIEKLGTQ